MKLADSALLRKTLKEALKQIEDARKECKIKFGHGWDLATFSSPAEIGAARANIIGKV